MLAPEPFFEPRGTPFSEYHRIKAIGELGHNVDLVTYPIGRDVELRHCRSKSGSAWWMPLGERSALPKPPHDGADLRVGGLGGCSLTGEDRDWLK